jgi:Zn-dependent protease
MFTNDALYWIVFAIPSILIASTIHEYAHGLAAFKLGDPTAKAEGRLTLNPLSHIDPLGALSMIIFRFGWSKPVPINENNFDKES